MGTDGDTIDGADGRGGLAGEAIEGATCDMAMWLRVIVYPLLPTNATEDQHISLVF